MNEFLWVVLPYVAITTFVVGHVWRYRYDKFGWTTRSSQLYETEQLSWASPLFHYGILGVLAGHVMGLLVPESVTSSLGISEGLYHAVALAGGTVTGLASVVGLVLLIRRRRLTPAVFRVTTPMDKALYLVLGLVVAFGIINTVGLSLVGQPHDYRLDVAVWVRGVLLLHPDAALMASAPATFQVHALLALALFALWPFTRLVHVLSVPLAYVARPYIVYRTRDERLGARRPRRGWEPPGS